MRQRNDGRGCKDPLPFSVLDRIVKKYLGRDLRDYTENTFMERLNPLTEGLSIY